MAIKTLLIDLDNTVLDFSRSERESISEALKLCGIEPTEQTVALYSKINDDQWKLLEKGKLTRDEVLIRRFRLLFRRLGVKGVKPETTQGYYETLLSQSAHYMSGAEEMLKALKSEGYKLYIASNGTARVQDGRIEKSGVDKYFDGVFISERVGFNKPAREFFDTVLATVGAKREETVMIGDSLSSDILGGFNAGIKTVFFNHNPEKITKIPAIPTVSVSLLSEVADALKTLNEE